MSNFDFIKTWESCLQLNIEQKPEEFKSLLDFLNVNYKNENTRKLLLQIR